MAGHDVSALNKPPGALRKTLFDGDISFRHVLGVVAVIAVGSVVAVGAPVVTECFMAPPIGPIEQRLPPGVVIAEDAAWCGPQHYDAGRPDAPEPWVHAGAGRGCHRLLAVERPGLSAVDLAAELEAAYSGFGWNNVDNGFGITPEASVAPTRPRSERVVIEQSRAC